MTASAPPQPTGWRTLVAQVRGIGLLAALAGGLLLVALVLHFGHGSIMQAISMAGLQGLMLLGACHLGVFVLMGAAWRALLPGPWPSGLPACIGSRMIRDAGSEALPLSQLGGYVLGTVALGRTGYPVALASASTMVDVTLEVVGQIVFVLTGLALLAGRPGSGHLLLPALAGLLVLALLIALFLLVQRRDGQSTLSRFLRRRSDRIADGWERLRGQLRTIHANPWALVACTVLHLACWFAIAAEAWLAMRLMRISISPAAAIILESLMFALRTLGFAIPNALGVQEAAYVMLSTLCGLSADATLSLSLLKRARDIGLGLLALGLWPLFESRLAVGSNGNSAPAVRACELDH